MIYWGKLENPFPSRSILPLSYALTSQIHPWFASPTIVLVLLLPCPPTTCLLPSCHPLKRLLSMSRCDKSLSCLSVKVWGCCQVLWRLWHCLGGSWRKYCGSLDSQSAIASSLDSTIFSSVSLPWRSQITGGYSAGTGSSKLVLQCPAWEGQWEDGV